MPAALPVHDALVRALDRLAADWERDAKSRRKLTPRDLAADTLDFCVGELRHAIAHAADADAELTVAEYAQLHGKSEPSVRRWCQTGAIRARRAGRTWLIPRSERPPAFGVEPIAEADAPATDQAA